MRSLFPLVVVAACAPGDGDDDAQGTPGPYEAEIIWTDHGIPHITADGYANLGFGMGYAVARDHGCTIYDQIVKVRGERARWFGEAYVDSDFGWRALGPARQAPDVLADLQPDLRDAITGYAAGITRWYEVAQLPEACADAPWLRPLTAEDVVTYALALVLDGSGQVFVEEVGRAQPPGSPQAPDEVRGVERLVEIAEAIRDPKRGSNGWAIGRDRTATGQGMLLSNTHFPAVGEKQWHEVHLTIPGELDVYGVSLVGVPVVNMGFNAHVAWTHTVSYAPRFVGYWLTLEDDPTAYAFEDRTREMEAKPYAVEVLGDDGRVRQVQRTLYRSHYGPVIDAPVVGWSDELAISLRDVNEGNIAAFDLWFGMNRADSLDALVEVHDQTMGSPWVYTMATGADGEVFFGDTSRVPYLSDEALRGWRDGLDTPGLPGLIASQFADFGVIGVDGSDPLYDWVDDPRAPADGIVPFEVAPTDRRTDYVFNANDSHWLHNAAEPLTGFSEPLYGAERTPRSGRTRMNGRYLELTGPGSASGDDGLFTLDELEAAALSMRSSLVEAALDGVVDRCDGVGDVVLADGSTVDVSEACDVLAAWSGTYTADARGAVLWREFLGSGAFEVYALNADGGGLFATAFDPDAPLSTPTDLVGIDETPPEGAEADPLLRALGTTVRAFDEAGWDLDVALGDVQFLPQGDPDDPVVTGVPGGQYWEGTIGIADWSPGATSTVLPWPERGEVVNATTERTEAGYPVNNGNSWILTVAFGDDGPEARAVMTYSQSEVWDAPYLADQAPIYASGSLRPVWFDRADVEANAVETETIRSGAE